MRRSDRAVTEPAALFDILTRGRAEILQDAGEKARALTLLMRWQTGKGIPVSPEQASRVTVLRIAAEEITGKQHS